MGKEVTAGLWSKRRSLVGRREIKGERIENGAKLSDRIRLILRGNSSSTRVVVTQRGGV